MSESLKDQVACLRTRVRELEEALKDPKRATYDECIHAAEQLLRMAEACNYNESYRAGIERVRGCLMAHREIGGPTTTPLDSLGPTA